MAPPLKGGRPKGATNLKTRAREYIGKEMLAILQDGDPSKKFPSAYERWRKLLMHRSGFVRVAAEKFIHEATFGKPRQQLDVNVTHDRASAVREAAQRIRAARGLEAPAIEAQLVTDDN